MDAKTVALAGGSGFIGRAIARRLIAVGGLKVRVLTRNPDKARAQLDLPGVEFVNADVAEPASLKDALQGADTIVDAIQFDGYPVENPSRGLTFERVDYGGTVALIDAAKQAGVEQFIYISGAAADENSTHPAFRAKGRAERAIRESGLTYTIFRPSLVYGPEDKVVNGLARALRFAPVFGVPGTGRQKVQPVLVDDLAACVIARRVGPRPQRDLRYRRPGSHDVRRDDAHHHGRERTSPPAVSHSRRHHARRRRHPREAAQAGAVARRRHLRHG